MNLNKSYLITLCFLISGAFAQSKTLAILPLNNLSNLESTEVQSISHKLEAEISKALSYKLVERSEMDEILKEQGFKETVLCDDDECPQEIGSLLGADIILTGTLGRVGEIFSITAKLVDVKTGRLLTAQSVEAQSIESLHIKGTSLLAKKLDYLTNLNDKLQPKSSLNLNFHLNPFGFSSTGSSTFYLHEAALSANFWFQPQWGASAQVNLGYFRNNTDDVIIDLKGFDINYSDFDMVLYQGIKAALSFKGGNYIISPFFNLNQGTSQYESVLLISSVSAEIKLIELKYGLEGTYLLGKNKTFGLTAGASFGSIKTTLTGQANGLQGSKEFTDKLTQFQLGLTYQIF